MFDKIIGLPLAFIERTCVDWCGQHPGGRRYFGIQSFRKAILLIRPDNRRVDETTRVDTRMGSARSMASRGGQPKSERLGTFLETRNRFLGMLPKLLTDATETSYVS
jgi:hypothetical protein